MSVAHVITVVKWRH